MSESVWRHRLASGELAQVAKRVPNRRALADHYGVALGTIKRVMIDIGTSFQQLQGGEDFADEEPTNPAAQVFDVSDAHAHEKLHAQENDVDVIPVGHFENGRSTLMKDGRAILTWHKTKVSQQEHREALLKLIDEVPKAWRGTAEIIEPPSISDADLLAVYCMGDPHLGMLAHADESGADHDLARGTADMISAVDHLVKIAPSADMGMVLSLGDLLDFDNLVATTTRGTRQDAAARWFRVMQETLRATRACIDIGLTKHSKMIGRIIPGNHDKQSSAAIAMGLAQFYENNPRVEIEVSPDPFSWFEFGKVLLGFTHSDECSKADDLASVMSCDRAEAWGRTIYRHILCGHLHHQMVKETRGVLVETFPTLAPKCAWSHSKGYRAQQSMCVDTYHREWGRVNRSTVGIRQLRAA